MAAGCVNDPSSQPESESPTVSIAPRTTTAISTTGVPDPVAEDVDWLAAIDDTIATSSATVTFDITVRAGRDESKVTVVTAFDVAAEAARSVIAGDTLGSREVVHVGDTAWISTHYWELRETFGHAIRWVEAPTEYLAAENLLVTDPAVYTAPLYILTGATSETLMAESDSRRTYSVELDPDLVLLRLPAEIEESFLQSMGALLDTERVETLTATAATNAAGRVIDVEVIAAIRPDVAGDQAAELAVRIRIANVGGEVRIEPPPSDTVVHVDDLGDLRDAALRSETGF